jgi:hypothetical protein
MYRLPDDANPWFQLDGEQKQIECYSDEDTLKMLTLNNVIVGKPPASTTSATQPCDVGNCFKGTKTTLRNSGDKNCMPHP